MSAAEQLFPTFPLPADEVHRLAALQRFEALDEAVGDDFDFLARMAARLCGAPYAFMTLVDGERTWFNAASGLDIGSQPRAQSYCSLAVLGDDATEIADLANDARTMNMPLTVQAPHMRMYSAIPLRTSAGYAIGAMCVMDTRPGRLNDEQLGFLRGLARQAMSLIEARASQKALRLSMRELELLATTDELTGLHNRRSLQHRLKFEVARARRFRTPLTALMIDLDHFKHINDEHGHLVGDKVLAEVARLVRDNVRVIDIAGRYGGEELCVLLPNTPLDGARKLAENLRAKIAAQVHYDGARRITITASTGIGVYNETDVSDAEALLSAADAALYRAKAKGRNCVES
jgi:diguanylate cyclase (GGDEF)-like protein